VAGSSPAAAFDYPYCIQSRIDATRCSFTSYNQCMASASGIGAECIVNPYLAFAQQSPQYSQPQPQRRARRAYDY
jgi:Protein of unknown function (DUF3551)